MTIPVVLSLMPMKRPSESFYHESRKSGIRSTVVSEEAGKIDFGSNEVVWAVDPLDGTMNYAKRIPYFAVSIGA